MIDGSAPELLPLPPVAELPPPPLRDNESMASFPHTPLSLPETPHENLGLNSNASLFEKVETLPLEIQNDIKRLFEQDRTTKEDFDSLIARAKTLVETSEGDPVKASEYGQVLQELSAFDAAQVNPNEMVGALRSFLDAKGSHLNTEEQIHAQEVMATLNVLQPELDQAKAYERDGREVPSIIKDKIMSFAMRLKKPLIYLGMGVVGFFLMIVMRGIKSVGSGGASQ